MNSKFKITLLGETEVTFEMGKDVAVLISMQNNSHNLIKVGCRGGGCGVCKVRVVRGEYHCRKMSRAHVSGAEESQGYALACCLYPDSDLEISTQLDGAP